MLDTSKPCYLFFDFDGTVYVDRTIKEETLHAMLEVQKMGHKLIMNTGRSYSEVRISPAAFSVPWDGYVLGAGDIRFEGKSLLRKTVSLSDAEKWLQYCMRHRLDLICAGEHYSVKYALKSHPQPFTDRETEQLLQALRADYAFNVICKMTVLQPLVESELPDTELTVISQHYADIFPKNCDKGLAILLFCQSTGVSIDQCICFGDSLNDIAMFSVCPTSVCMKQSPEALIKLATYHAQTDLGVAEGIRHYFMKNKKYFF